jgi:hypothetical protein
MGARPAPFESLTQAPPREGVSIALKQDGDGEMKRLLVVMTAVRSFDLKTAMDNEENSSEEQVKQIYKESAVDDPFAFIDDGETEVNAYVEIVEVK